MKKSTNTTDSAVMFVDFFNKLDKVGMVDIQDKVDKADKPEVLIMRHPISLSPHRLKMDHQNQNRVSQNRDRQNLGLPRNQDDPHKAFYKNESV